MNTIDKAIIEWFHSDFGTNFSNGIVGNFLLIFLSLFLSLALVTIIGWEREYHGHSAGLRTHLLVSIGSCLIMVISMYGFSTWDGAGLTRDPARLAAQVVSGIGFLGAGTIVQNGVSVRGLTTATTLWISMAIGLACGAGCFVIATIATALAFFALVSLRRVERFASKRNPVILLVVGADSPVLRDVILIADRFGMTVRETSSELVTFQDSPALRLTLRLSYSQASTITAFVDEIRFTIHPLEVKVSTEL